MDADTAELLVRAGQAVGRFRRGAAAAHGLTSTGLAGLAALARDGAVSHRELAARLGVTPATLTPVVDALTGTGDMARERDPSDRRVVRLSITDRGRARVRAALDDVGAAVAARMPATEPDRDRIVRDHLQAVLVAFEAR